MSTEEQISAAESSDDETQLKRTKFSDLKSVPSAIANLKKPVVLIVGGGIGGLTLGAALQRAGIDVGCTPYLVARHDTIDLLVAKIEPSRLLLNKKILSTQQNSEGVVVRTVDGSFYHGDILIGADGAYSAVRQSLYKELDKKGMLPDEDKKEMTMAYISMLGITRPLSPETYPCLKENMCNFATVLADEKPHSWTVSSRKNNKLGWSTWFQVTKEEAQQMMFRNSEWGSKANEALLEQIRGYPVKQGGTLGDLIDATDSDKISKVYIEEKLFQTWNHGRTALIGDAAHKLNPGGGQGAVSAMQDAVILANCIYELEDPTYENIQKALDEYKALRFEHTKIQADFGKTLGRLLYGQKWMERLLRKIIYNLPKWAQTQKHMKMATYRPILSFLPPPPNRGIVKFLPQKESERYAREQAASVQKLEGGVLPLNEI
ncbi:hypothetical protein BG004_006467 [Podila humilis]|nr:hypothetical protein BG004_006467 [Podila humilis]